MLVLLVFILFDSISDFGLSREVKDANEQFGTADDPERTPIRSDAPESLDPTRPFSAKSDVFMFGCALWEMWARRSPFDWIPSAGELKERRIKDKLDFAKEVEEKWNPSANISFDQQESKQVLKNIKKLMVRCLQFKAENRPTMKEVVQKLEQLYQQIG